jgi:single-stranded DNA-binding protein
VRSHTVFQLTAWEDLADYCGRHLHAGDRIFVEGQLRSISGRVVEGLCVNYEIVLERIVLLPVPPPLVNGNDA